MAKVSTKFLGYGILHQSKRFANWFNSKPEKFHTYRAEWARRPLERDAGSGPLNLNVEVTTRCNLACTFCSNTSLTLDQIGDLDQELYRKVIEDLTQVGGLAAVNLNGLGEPLLRQDFFQLVEIAKQNGVVDVMFHTNGTTLTEEVSNKLVNSEIDRVIVSVDSPNKETYEAMRLVKASWQKYRELDVSKIQGFKHEKLLKNTKYLIRTALASGKNSPVIRTTCILMEETANQMPEFIEMWKNEGADQITFQDLSWRDKLLEQGKWSNGQKNVLDDQFEKIKELAIESKVDFACPYLYQASWLNFNGDVVPCSNPEAREHMVMGNVQQKSFSDIWNDKPYMELRDIHNKGEWFSHPICGNCEKPLIEIHKHVTGETTVKNVNVLEDR